MRSVRWTQSQTTNRCHLITLTPGIKCLQHTTTRNCTGSTLQRVREGSRSGPSCKNCAHPVMPVPELPVDLWKLVLQHVPLKQRLAACALVCHKLHAAAIAATDSIQTSLIYQRKVDVFVEYLQRQGSHLTSITVNGGIFIDNGLVLKQFPSCSTCSSSASQGLMCISAHHLRAFPVRSTA